jgi:hypothetical protein
MQTHKPNKNGCLDLCFYKLVSEIKGKSVAYNKNKVAYLT